ncbi:MAG: ATP phosphoribosyltransferase regulatory subunit [Gammaproteobacteria bacterium]
MVTHKRWLLPEGIEEILPPHAEQLEDLCRRIIDLYRTWGYQLVMPPLVEFLESLLTGTGEDLGLQTFKLTDQISGRMMGIRADTTPQVARIDAHNLKAEGPNRLCYLGTVLHTRPESSGGSRSPLQVGAELYGHAGIESEAESLCLMLETLKLAGVEDIHIDLGHVGIYETVLKSACLDKNQETELFSILQRKATSELNDLLKQWSLPKKLGDKLRFLIMACGDASILDQAAKELSDSGGSIKRCLKELKTLVALVNKCLPGAPLFFDLAELRGYHYHTGIVFTAFVPGSGQGIAFGGRYDAIGQAFGQARPATGFSTDIKTLLSLGRQKEFKRQAIFAPAKEDEKLNKKIVALRKKGEIVIRALPGQKQSARQAGCDRKLQLKDGRWQVVKL